MMQEASHKTQAGLARKHILILVIVTLAMVLPGLASLPVIDRDEARYAQASVQMAQTNDWLNIRFQDEARNKKPAGIYWLQTASLKAFSHPNKRQIWVHRLPSVFGALLAVLATYWGGAKLIGREAAFIAGLLLASSLLFIFEAHIAKTDAVLCGLSACVLAAIAHLRAAPETNRPSFLQAPIWVFWIALGLSIMIKGPILVALVIFTFTALAIWEKTLRWAKPFLNPAAIVVFCLIWVPWAIAIYSATDGAFFQDSLGTDLGGKLSSAQESHPGPPGYHLAFIWVIMWPASLFLLPAMASACANIISSNSPEPKPLKAIRLYLAWVVPFWLILEIMPTKLPHYSLGLFPALCLLIGVSFEDLKRRLHLPKSRMVGTGLFLLASLILIGALVFVSFTYGHTPQKITASLLALIICALCLLAGYWLCKADINKALTSLISAAFIVSAAGYQFLLPNLPSFNISARIATELGPDLPRLSASSLYSPTYTEPSLVYHLGSHIILGGQGNPLDVKALKSGRIILVDALSPQTNGMIAKLEDMAQKDGLCLSRRGPISGMNYAKGERVEIHIINAKAC